MAVGDFKQCMTLQKQVYTEGAAVWQNIADLWVQMDPIATDTIVATGNYSKRLTHKLSIRYRDDVETGMRLVYGTRCFTLRAVINRSEKSAVTDLWAEEGGTL